ncbi:MAG TPA: methyltransferase domain-containing protein [Chitinophagaceae bacterium]|nr:methyltransferase domain-containing protein [Chitinophagaceae bacterium]
MPTHTINTFYNSTQMETDRLGQHVFQLEKARTQAIILGFLRSSMTIADIGGATGAYSFWLHDMGHRVHLLDAAEFHVEAATRISITENKPLASISLGDARELPYDDEQFDLVLLFGPLYHLQEKKDRIKAITESKRVLRKNGVLLSATITRYASLFDGFWQGFIDDPAFENILKQDLADGNHFNPVNHPMYFTDAHFHTQKEIEQEFNAAGFSDFEIKAIEGFGWLVPGFAERWNDNEQREQMLVYIRQTENDPVMIGISAHVMTIAKKS